MRQWVEILNVLNTLTLKQIFWKMEIFFKKLKYRFLVEITKIENASFPFKATMSEAIVKSNRMVSIKWTYQKGWSFASNCLIFLKILFSLRTSYIDLIWCANDPNAHIRTFWRRWSFIWRCFFPVSILNELWSYCSWDIEGKNIKNCWVRKK